MRCDATRRDATRREAKRRDATQRYATRRDATRREATRLDATRRNATQRDATRRDATRRDTTRHDTTRHDTTRHDTIRYDTYRISWHDSCIALVSSPRHSYRTLPYIIWHPSDIISHSLLSCDMMSEGCDTMYGRVRYECLGLDTSVIQESCHDVLFIIKL